MKQRGWPLAESRRARSRRKMPCVATTMRRPEATLGRSGPVDVVGTVAEAPGRAGSTSWTAMRAATRRRSTRRKMLQRWTSGRCRRRRRVVLVVAAKRGPARERQGRRRVGRDEESRYAVGTALWLLKVEGDDGTGWQDPMAAQKAKRYTTEKSE